MSQDPHVTFNCQRTQASLKQFFFGFVDAAPLSSSKSSAPLALSDNLLPSGLLVGVATMSALLLESTHSTDSYCTKNKKST